MFSMAIAFFVGVPALVILAVVVAAIWPETNSLRGLEVYRSGNSVMYIDPRYVREVGA